jgi:dihydropteroate synthase
MGVINVTPDSFSDGGAFSDPTHAVAHGNSLAQAGAHILDLGAEASSFFRPGVNPVTPEEQIRRLRDIIPALVPLPGMWLSVDTRSADVARHAINAGSAIINDISAGTHDSAMLTTVAELNAGIILMHITPGYPKTPDTDDPDILTTVRDYLATRITAALAAGISRNRIAIDPGIGFGKTMPDNWRLAFGCHELFALNVPVVLGVSRKRFLETSVPSEQEENWRTVLHSIGTFVTPSDHPRDRDSAALTFIAAKRGIPIHRLHNVTLAARALTLSPFRASSPPGL